VFKVEWSPFGVDGGGGGRNQPPPGLLLRVGFLEGEAAVGIVLSLSKGGQSNGLCKNSPAVHTDPVRQHRPPGGAAG
jgi:hypothetical protein